MSWSNFKQKKPRITPIPKFVVQEGKIGDLLRMIEFLRGRDDDGLDLALEMTLAIFDRLCVRADKK